MHNAPHVTRTLEILASVPNDILSRAVIAYSAGKDSLVAAHLLHMYYNVKTAVADNSFWFTRHYQDAQLAADFIGLAVTYEDRFGDAYVLKNPAWLFPERKDMGAIYAKRQQATVKGYALANNHPCVIYGRRTEENSVKAHFYRTADGLYQLHPIRHWTKQQVWDYIDYYRLPVPSIYQHQIGQLWGSTPWNFIVPAEIPYCYYRSGPIDSISPSERIIRSFCPTTHQRLEAIGIFRAYQQRLHP